MSNVFFDLPDGLPDTSHTVPLAPIIEGGVAPKSLSSHARIVQAACGQTLVIPKRNVPRKSTCSCQPH